MRRFESTPAGARSPRAGLGVAVAVLMASVAGCAPGQHRGAQHHAIVLHAITFDPAELAVAVGDTVEWNNRDVVPHTVTAEDHAWDSGTIAPDSSWSTVIRQPGALRYTCTIHPSMKGQITAR